MQSKIYLPLTVILFLLTTSYGYGQDFAIGLKGGFSSRNLTNGQGLLHIFAPSNHLNIDGQGALFVDYKINDFFSIQPMIEYSPQGSKSGVFVNSQPISGSNYLVSAQLNYVMVPVLAKVGWFIPDSKVRIYLDAGPYLSFLTAARQLYSVTQYDANNNTYYQQGYYAQDVKSQLNGTNIGIEGNLGLAYYFSNFSVFAEGGGNYSLSSIQKNMAGGGNKTGAVAVSIGLSYWFNKHDFRTDSHVRPLL